MRGCALKKGHYPMSPALAWIVRAGHSGPRSGALPDGFRIQVEADRAGVDARGEQVECRVVGGRSCVETIVGFEFYCVDWCAHPINS